MKLSSLWWPAKKAPELSQKNATVVRFQIQLSGLHCTSCALNIDMALEDLSGVKDVKTDYARQQTTIQAYKSVDFDLITARINALGYQVVKIVKIA